MLCFTMSHMGSCFCRARRSAEDTVPGDLPSGTCPSRSIAYRKRPAGIRMRRRGALDEVPPPETGNSARSSDRASGSGSTEFSGVPVDRVSLRLDPSSHFVPARNWALESSITVRERCGAYVRGRASAAMERPA